MIPKQKPIHAKLREFDCGKIRNKEGTMGYRYDLILGALLHAECG